MAFKEGFQIDSEKHSSDWLKLSSNVNLNPMKVNTIAFGSDASLDLGKLSRDTGGSDYFSDPDSPNSVLQDAFIAELQKDENQAYPIVSIKKPIGMHSNEEFR